MTLYSLANPPIVRNGKAIVTLRNSETGKAETVEFSNRNFDKFSDFFSNNGLHRPIMLFESYIEEDGSTAYRVYAPPQNHRPDKYGEDYSTIADRRTSSHGISSSHLDVTVNAGRRY